MPIKINNKLNKQMIVRLKPGDEVLYTGVLYTARDQAHKRLTEALRAGRKLPVDLKGQIIYYCGPAPSRKKDKFSSAGPTTSSRMDKFTPALLSHGVIGMIGKGGRSEEVIRAIKNRKAVYFLAIGGAGAYLAKRIKKAEAAAYKDLGPEAIYRLEVEDFPLTVGIDSRGKDIYIKN